MQLRGRRKKEENYICAEWCHSKKKTENQPIEIFVKEKCRRGRRGKSSISLEIEEEKDILENLFILH